MGTRLNYEIISDEPDAQPAAVLYSNSRSLDAEELFRASVQEFDGRQTDLVRHLLSLRYPVGDMNGQANQPIFTIDLDPGDREKVLRAVMKDPGFEVIELPA